MPPLARHLLSKLPASLSVSTHLREDTNKRLGLYINILSFVSPVRTFNARATIGPGARELPPWLRGEGGAEGTGFVGS